MGLIRSFKNKDYTVMCNHHLNDNKLSLKSKGLLSFMLSKPDNWNFSINGLKSQLKEGRESVRTGIIELEKYGYVVRIPKRNDLGQIIDVDYHVYEKPKTGSLESENQTSVNGLQVNTNTSKDCIKQKTEESCDLFGNKSSPNKKTLFSNSPCFELLIFISKLKEASDLGVDVEYYHRGINNWSDSSNTKRTMKGWIATARTWMEKDKDKGSLRMAGQDNKLQTSAEMREYLDT